MKKHENMQGMQENVGGGATLKGRIIPDEWKDTIDARLKDELLKANRAFAQEDLKLKELVDKQARQAPETFYSDLRERWGWHHSFYEDWLEPALSAILPLGLESLTPSRVTAQKEAYQTACQVDRATLVPTTAIKKHLDYWTTPEKTPDLNDEERLLLITPPTESFWIQYAQEHLRYLAANLAGEDTSKMEAELLAKYHAGDLKIFHGRMREFDQYRTMTPDEIKAKSDAMSINPSRKTAHFYLTLERPRLKALRDIMIYDNVEEYRILKSLIGISGFVLRKRVLAELNESGILPNDGAIYAAKETEVTEALASLEDRQKDRCVKNVTLYRQTGDTCSTVCFMMATNYLSGTNIDRETENTLHGEFKSNYIKGDHFSALARKARQLGLEARLLHSEDTLFRQGRLDQDLFHKLMGEYKEKLQEAQDLGAEIYKGIKLGPEEVRKLLEDDFLVIIAGHVGEAWHAIIATGYEGNSFAIVDPLSGRQQNYSLVELARFMQTDIGRWALALRDNSEALKSLLASCPRFKEQASKYLE